MKCLTQFSIIGGLILGIKSGHSGTESHGPAFPQLVRFEYLCERIGTSQSMSTHITCDQLSVGVGCEFPPHEHIVNEAISVDLESSHFTLNLVDWPLDKHREDKVIIEAIEYFMRESL